MAGNNFSKGAEAEVHNAEIIGISAVEKIRTKKSYRVPELDKKLRKERTRIEARLLHKAKLAGVCCPTVLEVSNFSIVMTKIKGKRPKMTPFLALESGSILAKLHGAGIIHGDFTPANLLVKARSSKLDFRAASSLQPQPSSRVYVIDFGLGFFSKDVEDKAVDVLTMLKAIDHSLHHYFIRGYSEYKNHEQVLKRMEGVKKRARYAF